MPASILNHPFASRAIDRRDILEDVLDASLGEVPPGERDNWTINRSPPWLQVEYRYGTLPPQGWKVHISATPNSASDVLSACLPILLSTRVCFKFILNRSILGQFNSPHAPRMSSGKFITIYPTDLNTFRQIIVACDQATKEFRGPCILSDRPVAAQSSVYYRYGAFRRMVSYDVDGIAINSLRDGMGNYVPDVRGVSFRQPEWTTDPLVTAVGQVRSPPIQTRAASVLLHDRYAVTHAIRHANKGGVYLAVDQLSGDKVVIKEARPYVATDHLRRDATDRLAREAENLAAMQRIGVTPKVLDLFWESGHLFLVLEWIAGTTLRDFILERRRSSVTPLPRRTLNALCAKVARLLMRCHAGGFILRDFTPNNIMLLPTGRLLLIDLEMACRAGGDLPIGIGEGTPGYASPEQIDSTEASLEDDYFSLGSTLFFLATLRDPLFPDDDPPTQRREERLNSYLALYSREWGLARGLVHLISSCLSTSPPARYSPSEVLKHLELERRNSATPRLRRHLIVADNRASIEEAVAHTYSLASQTIDNLSYSLDFASGERPMRSTCLGENSHPCNIQHGAAGIGLSLIAHAQVRRDTSHLASLRALSRWILRYMAKDPEAPPGLYFGIAGTAWFLLAAADLLHDAEVKEASLAMALALPLEPPISDITHGGAGIGLTLLHFFHQTGNPEFLSRALQLAEHLQSNFCISEPVGSLWNRTTLTSSPADPKDLAYGFAHGIAGVAYFFLCLYLSLRMTSSRGDPFLAIAQASTNTLLSAASKRGSALYWQHGPSRPVFWPHWCNGSSGVGAFLIRFGTATGDHSIVRVAIGASRAVLRERWTSGLSQCHGLAGNGEYLLDLFQFTGNDQFLKEALYLVDLIDLHRVLRPFGITFPDDTGFPAGLDFSIGSAGVASFFARLAGNQPRYLMLDYLISQDRRCTRPTSIRGH